MAGVNLKDDVGFAGGFNSGFSMLGDHYDKQDKKARQSKLDAEAAAEREANQKYRSRTAQLAEDKFALTKDQHQDMLDQRKLENTRAQTLLEKQLASLNLQMKNATSAEERQRLEFEIKKKQEDRALLAEKRAVKQAGAQLTATNATAENQKLQRRLHDHELKTKQADDLYRKKILPLNGQRPDDATIGEFKKLSGVDMATWYDHPEEMENALQTMNGYVEGLASDGPNPQFSDEELKAFHTIFSGTINRSVGTTARDGGVIKAVQPAGITPLSNGRFGVELQVTAEKEDGTRYSYAAPMTTGGTSDAKKDPNVAQIGIREAMDKAAGIQSMFRATQAQRRYNQSNYPEMFKGQTKRTQALEDKAIDAANEQIVALMENQGISQMTPEQLENAKADIELKRDMEIDNIRKQAGGLPQKETVFNVGGLGIPSQSGSGGVPSAQPIGVPDKVSAASVSASGRASEKPFDGVTRSQVNDNGGVTIELDSGAFDRRKTGSRNFAKGLHLDQLDSVAQSAITDIARKVIADRAANGKNHYLNVSRAAREIDIKGMILDGSIVEGWLQQAVDRLESEEEG